MRRIEFLLALMILLCVGCIEQRDLFIDDYPQLLVKNNWNPGRIDPKDGATLMTYPLQNPVALMEDANRKVLGLNAGEYDIMVFNRYFFSQEDTNLENIRYRGTDNFYTFEAYATTTASRFRASPEEVIINNPDTLATRSTSQLREKERRFVLKYRDGKDSFPTLNAYIDDSIHFVPCRVTHVCRVYAHVQNIKTLQGKGKIHASLRGFAGSVFLAKRMPSHDIVTQQFGMNGLVYDSGSVSDGTISASFSTFGPPLDLFSRKYELELNVLYASGKTTKFTFDITNQILPQAERMAQEWLDNKPIMDDIIVRVELKLEDDTTDTGGVDATLEDWGGTFIITVTPQ